MTIFREVEPQSALRAFAKLYLSQYDNLQTKPGTVTYREIPPWLADEAARALESEVLPAPVVTGSIDVLRHTIYELVLLHGHTQSMTVRAALEQTIRELLGELCARAKEKVS